MSSEVNMDHYEQLGCLHEMFVKQAQQSPDKIAVVYSTGQKITFGQLDYMSDVLAIKLRRIGVDRNKVVGILMERCVEYTISYLAILKAGGAYVPIEVAYPESLLESVIEDARPVAICTKSNFLDRLSNTIPIILLENNWLDLLVEENIGYEQILKSVEVTLDDMAYTVYSSGTTGKPKGIQCPHRGAVFSYVWRHLAYPYEQDDREACNVFFVWEMLRPLLKGIPMYIIPDDVIYDPPKLLQFLEENCITRILVTPSLLQAIFEHPAVNVQKGFKTIRQLWLCGEVVTMSLRNLVVSSLPSIKLLNLYSVSECHDVAAADLSSGAKLENRTYCPCGKVIPGVHVVILDENMNPVPAGSSGEVYVGGPTLAIGYLKMPALNSQRFIQTPKSLDQKVIGSRLYRTGDSGYLLNNSYLEIIGRCDTMVKIRGYTVELKAVEIAIMSIPVVKMVCVLVLGDEGASDKVLTAYVVLQESSQTVGCSTLKQNLKEKLPFYMIPSQIIYLDKIPIKCTTGKIDKDVLPKVDEVFHKNKIIIDQSFTQMEKIVANVWCEVLRICSVEKDDNFFELGGHSLLAAIAIGKINEICKSDLSTVDIYANPTVQTLTNKLENHTDSFDLDLRKELENNSIKMNISPKKLHSFWRSITLCRSTILTAKGNILLTGVTGFLGYFVLRELLLTTDLTVYCLIRAQTDSASERLNKILNLLHGLTDAARQRVICIEGDVSLCNFGLDESDYLSLCYDVHSVIHAASNVNLVLPYSALYRTNVLGTKNVLNFCLRKRLKPLHYVSTNDVFPANATSCTESYVTIDKANQLQNGYGQTKWISEQLIMSASNAGLPTIISRCGNLSGPLNSTDWKWNSNDLILYIIRSVVSTGVAPDINWMVELTPVDFASRLIVKLSQNITSYCDKIFHIIDTNPIYCRDLWSMMNEMGFNVDITSYKEWTEKVKSAAIQCPPLRMLLPLLHSVLKREEYLSCNDNRYERGNLNEFLHSENLSYPVPNKHLFAEYFRRLIKYGYIRQAENTLERQLIRTNDANEVNGGDNLKGKLIFVVGASSGIGYSIAEQLALQGAKVVAAARTFNKLVALKQHNKNSVIPLQLDITDKYQVENAVDYIETMYGPINVFVNSAGVMSYCKTVNAELEDWRTMLRVNCEAALNCIVCVLPKMIDRRTGHIIHITSDAGRKAFPGLAVYSGTKFFLEAFSSAMRQEIAEYGVKVTCIQPGDVETGLHQKSKDKQALKEYSYDIPYLQPKNVADAVLFALKQPGTCAINEILVEPILGPL